MTATHVPPLHQDPVFDPTQIECIPTPTVLLDRTGTILAVNTLGADTLAPSAPGSPLSVLTPDLLRAACEHLSESGPDTRAFITIDTACQRQNGTWFDAELTLARVNDASRRIITLVRDTTKYRDSAGQTQRLLTDLEESRHRISSQAVALVAQAEALHASEESLRMVIDSVEEGYWDWDVPAGTVALNHGYFSIIGETSTDGVLSLKGLMNRIHDSDRRAVIAAIEDHVNGSRHDVSCEFRVLHASGQWVWVRARGHAVMRDDQGTPTRVTGLVTNITQERRSDQERRRVQKLESVGRLAAGVAHEINTPLQFVGDNLAFLSQQGAVTEEAFSILLDVTRRIDGCEMCGGPLADVLKRVEELDLAYAQVELPRAIADAKSGVDHVHRIVRALKDFVHPNATQQMFADFNRVVENALTISINEWRRVAEVEFDLAVSLPPVWCAPGEVGQTVVNLIVNAAQAIEERTDQSSKGRITVRTTRAGTFVALSVTDTGVGIPGDSIDRIFEPFYTTKPVGKGTGQGLARVRAIAEAHGGQVTCTSELGRGTTFTVLVPFQPVEQSA